MPQSLSLLRQDDTHSQDDEQINRICANTQTDMVTEWNEFASQESQKKKKKISMKTEQSETQKKNSKKWLKCEIS